MWLNRRGPPIHQILFLSLVLGTIVWSTQTQMMRYYIVITPFLCIVSALVLQKWSDWHQGSAVLAKMAVILFTIWGVVTFTCIVIENRDPLATSIGLESRYKYLQRKLLTSYIDLAERVKQLPKQRKVLLFGGSRTYYYEGSVVAASPFDEHPIIEMLKNGEDADYLWRELRSAGYTHLVVLHGDGQRTRGYEPYQWTEKAIAEYQKLISHYVQPIYYSKDQQVIYQLLEKPNFIKPLKKGKPLFTEPLPVVTKVQSLIDTNKGIRQHEKAIMNWKKIQEIVPYWWVPYQIAAWHYYQLQKPGIAVALYQKAESLGWLDATGYAILADGMARQGDFVAAKKYFKEALKQKPDFETAKQGLNQVEKILSTIKK